MPRIGYFLSSEDWKPEQLLIQARAAEAAGFEGLWISDHYHPWNDEQGESSFVWSVIGALSQVTRLPVAGWVGDGFISTTPDADLLRTFRDTGGAGKPTQEKIGRRSCAATTSGHTSRPFSPMRTPAMTRSTSVRSARSRRLLRVLRRPRAA